jgi:hypothetical protein
VGVGEVVGQTGEVGQAVVASDPGALVAVTINSSVGVLLDEIPVSQRTRQANLMIAKPASFWVARAKRQIEHTGYRLIYRNFYYGGFGGQFQGGSREMMPLPQPELWAVTLNGEPVRTTIQGHDVVVISYSMRTTVLTLEDHPAKVEPRLSHVGGTWDEPFSLPLDPELTFQRTGYACIDEEGYPPNTVDAENAPALFDNLCEAGANFCHVTQPAPTESCADALVRAIGRVDVPLHFERIAWNAAIANQFRTGTYTQPTPDMQPIAEALNDNRITYTYIEPNSCAVQEGCVSGTGWRRLLRFTASAQNTGASGLAVGPTTPDSPYIQHNVFEFSQCHDHFHFSHYANFSFGNTPGEKRAFCLESTSRLFNSETTPWGHPFGCANQGIESGWGDDYIAGIECQWIDITGQTAATRNLTFQSNPDGFICEGTPLLDGLGNQVWEPTSFVGENGLPVDRPVCSIPPAATANNAASVPVKIAATGGYTLKECNRGQTGPVRDCGWRETAVRTCLPGSTVNLTCTPKKATDPMQAVRVCEASAALGGTSCVYRDALANTSVDGQTTVSFTCPAPRGGVETGGRYSLYFAPVVDGDATGQIDCK